MMAMIMMMAMMMMMMMLGDMRVDFISSLECRGEFHEYRADYSVLARLLLSYIGAELF